MDTSIEKVSVIIPAYNAERFIARSIASVQRQTFSNVEIIVVNDGSNDKTRELVESLCEEDTKIKLVNTENRGVSCARNTGIEQATGDWIMFLDADDQLFEDAVESLLACAKTHNLDIISGKYQYVSQDEVIERMDSEEILVYVANEAILRSLEDHPETYSACAKLFKHSAIKDVRFPQGRRVHEDSFFVFCCLAEKPAFGVYDKTVYRYYVTPDSASNGRFSEKLFDILALAEEKRRIVEEKFPEYNEQSRLMLLKANMSLLKNFLKTNERKYHPIEKECLKFVKKNQDCFKAAISSDQKWFWVLKHRFYWPYKFLYRLKHRNTIS